MDNNSVASSELKQQALEKEINNKWWMNFWTTIIFWIGIIIFLAFLGFNVFSALGESNDFVGDIFKKINDFFNPILDYLGINNIKSEDKDKKVSTDKNKSNPLINQVSNSQVSGMDKLQKSINNPEKDNLSIEEDGKIQNYMETDSFNKRYIPSVSPSTAERKSAKEEKLIEKRFPISDSLPEPYESNTFNTIATGHGYCFIGEDKGIRSCIKTEDVGSCPTGLGYQSEAVCQNPQLRD